MIKKISLSLVLICGIIFSGGAVWAGEEYSEFTVKLNLNTQIVVPPAPTNLRAEVIYSTGIKLDWNSVIDDSGAKANKYFVYYRRNFDPDKDAHDGRKKVTGTSYTVPAYDLWEGAKYYFRVSAVSPDEYEKEGKLSEQSITEKSLKVIYSSAERIKLRAITPVLVGNGKSESKIEVWLEDNQGNTVIPGDAYDIKFEVVSGPGRQVWPDSVVLMGEKTESTLYSSISSSDDVIKVKATSPGLKPGEVSVKVIKNIDYPQEFKTVSEAKEFLDSRGTALQEAIYLSLYGYGQWAEMDTTAWDEYNDIVSPNWVKIAQQYGHLVASMDTWLDYRNNIIPSMEKRFPGLEDKTDKLAIAISNFAADPDNLQLFDEMVAKAQVINDNYDLNEIYNNFDPAYEIVNDLVSQEDPILAALSDINTSEAIVSAPARPATLKITEVRDWLKKGKQLYGTVKDILNLGKVVRDQENTILDTEILNTMKPTKMSNGNEYNIRTQDYTSPSSKQTYPRCEFITNPDKEGKPICDECYVDTSKASDLNAGNIPQQVDSVLGGFAGITLSPKATVIVIEANKKWVIIDPYPGGGGAFKYSIIKYENSLYIYEGDQALGYANTRVRHYDDWPLIFDEQDKLRAWAANTNAMSEWWKVKVGEAVWKHLKEWAELASNFIPYYDVIKIIIKKYPRRIESKNQ